MFPRKRVIPILVGALSCCAVAAGQSVYDRRFPVRSVDQKGRPLPHAKIYSVDLYGNQGDGFFLGETDGKGILSIKSMDEAGRRFGGFYGIYLGVAPDGRIGVTLERPVLRFGASGRIRMRIVDGKGKPLPGQAIFLNVTTVNQPLRPYGTFFPEILNKDLKSKLSGQTNGAGFVEFSKMPKGIWFGVYADIGMFEPMRFYGAVRVGKVYTALINKDCELHGHLYDASGKPLAGASVILTSTSEAHIYDDREVKRKVTDATGMYRMTGLPNCSYWIRIANPQADEFSMRTNRGRWVAFERLTLRKASTQCDLRISKSPAP